MTELDGHEMLGRPVRIKPGVTKSASERTGERTGEQNRAASTNIVNARWRGSATTTTPVTDSNQRVYVGGLPRVAEQETIERNIKTFFQGFSVYVPVPFHPLWSYIDFD